MSNVPEFFQVRSIASGFPEQEPPTRREMPSSRMIVACDRSARKLLAAVALLETGEVHPADLAGTLREVVSLLEGRAS